MGLKTSDVGPSSLSPALAHLRSLIEKRHAEQEALGRSNGGSKPLHEQVWSCETHGDWRPYVLDDSGVLRVIAAVCPVCRREAALKSFGRESATPSAFDLASFESFTVDTARQERAVSLVRRQATRMSSSNAADRAGGLVLWGGEGTGKTHLAIALMRECQAKGFSGHFIRAVVLMPKLQQARSFQARHDDLNLLDRLSDVDVLVIDDVGKTLGNDFERSGLFALIDTRWAYSRPTIITTNASPTDLKDLLTPAGFDRLTAGGANILRMDWKSHRSIRVVSP